MVDRSLDRKLPWLSGGAIALNIGALLLISADEFRAIFQPSKDWMEKGLVALIVVVLVLVGCYAGVLIRTNRRLGSILLISVVGLLMCFGLVESAEIVYSEPFWNADLQRISGGDWWRASIGLRWAALFLFDLWWLL